MPLFNLRPCLLAFAIAISPWSTFAVGASDATVETFDIPAGPLGESLSLIARQSGQILSVQPELIQGQSAPAVRGKLTAYQAVQHALAGTGLVLVVNPGGSWSLSQQSTTPSSSNAVDLGATEIYSAHISSPVSEDTRSYTYSSPTTSATKMALTPKETPQSISVFTRQRIDDQKLESVIDVLDSTIGVSSFRQSVGVDLNQPYSRGFAITNYLIDGIPRGSMLASQSNLMNTAIFDRVEVLRGATGMTSGMGYPGASINMVRKRPTYEPQASITTEAGSWDRYGLGVDVSGPLTENGRIRSRFVADYKDQNNWLDRYESKSSVLYGITEVDLNDDTLLTWGINQNKINTNSPLRSGVKLYYTNGQKIDLPRSYNNAPDWSYYDTEEINSFISVKHQISDNWQAHVEFNYLNDSYNGVLYYNAGNIDPVTGMGGVMQPVKWINDSHQYSLDSYISGDFSLLGLNYDLVAGIASSYRRSEDLGYGNFLASWNSNYNGTISTPIWGWDGTGSNYPQFTKQMLTVTKTNEKSAYLTSRIHLTDQTKIIFGGRVLDWKNIAEAETLASGVKTKTKKLETGVTVPYVGLIHDINDSWSVYGSYTQIFNPQSAAVLDINRQTLPPEEGAAYEVGIKSSFNQSKLNATLALFKIEQDKLASYNATISAYELLEGINTEGVELELSGELSDGWNISSGYAYSLSEDAAGARVMQRIPRHSVKTFTTYRMSGYLDRLTVGGGVNWQSQVGWDGAKNYDWDVQDSYYLVNLMARYDLNKSTQLSANLNNALDKKYYTALADIGLYGPPRNLMFSMKYKF